MPTLGIEVRVGAFVLAALAVLVGFVLVLGDFSLSPGHRIHADFAYAGGLQVGAPVKVSGIRVGRVSAMTLLSPQASPPAASPHLAVGRSAPPVVRVSLVVDEEAKPLLTEGADFYIGMQGVIGEAYVEMEPGKTGASQLAEESAVRGVDAPRLHVMILHLSSLLRTFTALIGLDEHNEGLSALGQALASLAGSVDGIVTERRDELSQAVADTAAVAANLRSITAGVEKAVGDGDKLGALIENGSDTAALLKRDLPALLTQANRSLDEVEELTKQARAAVDPAQIEEIVQQTRRTLAHLEKTAVDAREVMDTIRRGEGSVGGFVSDPQLYDDTKELLRDLKRNPWKLFWRD